ncbi:MAG TPA: AGE family epimerase/isomerase [Longimicrobiales bacterium]|nr:AGE family epimerase/isomerase [Longimicrobiales bacterium]
MDQAGASREALASFYLDHLEHDVLPFWLSRAVDDERGGVFTCIENTTGQRVSDDKFVWSQARWAWTMAHASRLAERGVLRVDANPLREHARRTADFLLEHAFLDSGAVAYLLAADGSKKEFIQGQGHDLSFFADGFVILGLTGVARATRESAYLERAIATYDSLRTRLARDAVRSEPYPLPPGCRAHAWPMIMLNVAQELERATAAIGHPRADGFVTDALAYMDAVLDGYVRDDDLIQEVRCSPDTGDREGSLLTRHVTPGHAIESMWFVMEEAVRHDRRDAIATAARVIKASFGAGWDRQHGGLFRYVVPGASGPRPVGPANDAFERLIVETWDTKIWWPHSETLYATLLASDVTGDGEMRRLHDVVHAYTFATFPNPDASVGEWIQIRDRRGRPLDKVVGLPVKDPYHLTRNLLLLVELLYDGLASRTTLS